MEKTAHERRSGVIGPTVLGFATIILLGAALGNWVGDRDGEAETPAAAAPAATPAPPSAATPSPTAPAPTPPAP